ncbi:MAG: DUF1015 domain-containing protein [Promethearchaeota archaeon]
MVKIRGIKAFRPVDVESFVIKPYDVISKEEEILLKKNPNSSIHLIIPDGKGKEVYENAAMEINRLISEKIIIQDNNQAIFVYRQESPDFSQEGIIFCVSLDDYEAGTIKRNENIREKPLKDRTAHINATKMNTGLVWTVYKKNETIQSIMEKIKNQDAIFDFNKYGYRHIGWKSEDPAVINEIQSAFRNVELYIADGHHRTSSAMAYRNQMKNKNKGTTTGNENWSFFMVYAASDHQIRILPYNRVIKKLNMNEKDFLNKISDNFIVEQTSGAFTPEKVHEIGMFMKDTWYKLTPRQQQFDNFSKSLDVSIILDYLINPILGINDIRKDENIFFVGGITDSIEMEKFITEKENAIFFSLYPTTIKDLEMISDTGEIMPPKSTWFDPKLLSGLLFNPLF